MEQICVEFSDFNQTYAKALEYEKDINKEQVKVQIITEGLEKLDQLLKVKIQQEQMLERVEGEAFTCLDRVDEFHFKNEDAFESAIVASKECRVRYLEANKKVKNIEKDCITVLRRLRGTNEKIIEEVYEIIDAFNPEGKKEALECELKTANLEFDKLLAQLMKCLEYLSIVEIVADLGMVIRGDVVDGGDVNVAKDCIKQCEPLLKRVAELNTFVLREGEFYDTFEGDYTIRGVKNWDKLDKEIKKARGKLRSSINKQLRNIINISRDYYSAYSDLLLASDVALEKFRRSETFANATDEDMTYYAEMLEQVENQISECDLRMANINSDKKVSAKILEAFNVDVDNSGLDEFNSVTDGASLFLYLFYSAFDLFLIPLLLIRVLSGFINSGLAQRNYDKAVDENLVKVQGDLDMLQRKYPNLISSNEDFVTNDEVNSADEVLSIVAKIRNMRTRLDDMLEDNMAEKRYLTSVAAKFRNKMKEIEELKEV